MVQAPLLLLLYITSSPGNFKLRETARSTYLSTCIKPRCMYQFFIDISLDDVPSYEYSKVNESSIIDLHKEYHKYNDIIFKNNCSLMINRHQDNRINYGNSAPTYDHIHFIISNITNYGKNTNIKYNNITRSYIPDYKYRRMYKIDWKVCFLQWSLANNMIHAVFHAFIEDDSFICTNHVLYQAELYYNIINKRPIRSGTRLWSGYDDSFTLLSSEIAYIFAKHYPNNGFNCSHIIDTTSNDILDYSVWLSWGNSWIHDRCNWTSALKELYHLDVIEPSINCFQSVFNSNKNIKYNNMNPYDDNITNDYPCSREPIVYHHHHAFKLLLMRLDKKRLSSLCSRMMFIDKIKDSVAIKTLWNITNTNSNSNTYINYTPIFLHDNGDGWKVLLDDYKRLRQRQDVVKY